MTDSVDFRRVKEAEALAKKLGFSIEHALGKLIIYPAKGLPKTMFGDKTKMECTTVEEARAWLKGWEQFLKAMVHVGFDEAEYKKRYEDQIVLDALKSKKGRK